MDPEQLQKMKIVIYIVPQVLNWPAVIYQVCILHFPNKILITAHYCALTILVELSSRKCVKYNSAAPYIDNPVAELT